MNTITYENLKLTALQKKEYQNQMINFLMGQDFNYFVTLNFWVPATQEREKWNDLGSSILPNSHKIYHPALHGRKIKYLGIYDGVNDLPVNYASARNAMKHWQARIDRHLLDRTWSKHETDQRLFFIAFPELGRKSKTTDHNLHYHLLMRAPYDPYDFVREAHYNWVKIIPSGQAHIRKIGETKEDQYRTLNYATKRIMADDGISNFIISTEFQA